MDLDQETAKELVKSVIDGFEEESIVNAESVTLFLCRECLPYLTKMNIPANIVQAVNGLAEKNEDLTAAGSLTDLVIAQDGRLQRVIVAGFGKGDECKPNNLRKAAGSAARALIAAKIKHTAVVAPILSNPARAHYLAALAEGLVLGGYQFTECKGKPEAKPELDFSIISGIPDAERVLAEAEVVADAVCYTRDLVNRPGNLVTPSVMAEEAEALALEYDMEFEILDVTMMEAMGMHALLAVGQGSIHPPCLVTIKYNGAGAAPYTAYVGKGITFDSGGISIKPSDNMGEMKDDMAGAGVVLGALRAIAALKIPCNVMGIIACAENMPSGSAQRPGDVVKAANGKTIEVISTDAEGRMVLADAVWYACKQGAAKVVDIATLTGGVIVALGTETAGIVGNDDVLIRQLIEAGKKAGESYWQLPALPECKEALKSDVADLLNSAGREASCISGGLFIGEFVEAGIPWAHIDIGGTSTAAKNAGFKVKGGTGFGVSTLIKLAQEM